MAEIDTHRQTPILAQDESGKYLALLAALLGWMFDGFEIGMFPLVGHNSLMDLLGDPITSRPGLETEWFGVIMSAFLIGAATGGVIFGWLGDRIGRVVLDGAEYWDLRGVYRIVRVC